MNRSLFWTQMNADYQDIKHKEFVVICVYL